MSRSTLASRSPVPLILSVLGAGFTSGVIPAGLLPANVLNIESAYGLSHSEMGRIIGLSMILGGCIGGLASGFVCGRIGALRTLLLSFVMVAASLCSIGLIRSFHATVIGLVGYFFAHGFMGSSNALSAHMLRDRQRGVTLLHGFNAMGKLAGPLLASLFLYGAWRYGFLTIAALALILAVPAAMSLAHGGSNSIGRKQPEDGHAGIGFWMAVMGFAFIAGSEIAVALWIPAYGQKVRHFTATESNMLLSIFLVGLIVGRFASSALSKKLSTRQIIGICGASVVFAIPAVSFTSYPLASVSFLLFGLAFSAMWPTYFAHLAHIFPERLGLMSGAAMFTTQIGFAVCSYTSGRLAEVNLAYPILFGAGVMGFFTLIFFAVPAKAKEEVPVN